MTDEAKLKPQDREEEISGEWKHDNQQWWNQYMASADNAIVSTSGSSAEKNHSPEYVGSLPKVADLQAELNALSSACRSATFGNDPTYSGEWFFSAEDPEVETIALSALAIY